MSDATDAQEPWDAAQDYVKGPVVMRRSKVPHETTDQRLLDSRGSADWVHTDPWRVDTYVTECGSHVDR